MTIPLIDLTRQYESIRDEIREVMDRVLRSQVFILGPEVQALEKEVAAYVGADHAIGVASGTDALLLPLKALDAEPGSDVIVPAFTFFASAGAVWNAGFRPVFCDVDAETFNVTAETVEAAWTGRTRAVVVVHLFGQMAEMGPIRELARKRGAFVLEDAAQAIGAAGPLGKVGSAGDSAAFSFFPTKNLGGFGDGGMVTTNDAAHADRVRKLRVHGGQKMYHHELVGTNSRLDALQAAILRVKLPYLDRWTAARRRNAERYDEELAGIGDLCLPTTSSGNHHVYNQYTVRTTRRDELREHLNGKGIGTGVYYPVPLHLQRCFAELGFREGDLPVSETLCREVLSLPIYPELSDSELDTVVEAVREFYA
jgi:dTDP-4-amino-4,6-dideoxygalactose transaminase